MFADFVICSAQSLSLFGAALNISPAAFERGSYTLAMIVGLVLPYAVPFGVGKAVFRPMLMLVTALSYRLRKDVRHRLRDQRRGFDPEEGRAQIGFH